MLFIDCEVPCGRAINRPRHSTVECSTVQYSAVQYSTVQYSTCSGDHVAVLAAECPELEAAGQGEVAGQLQGM